MAIRTFYDPGAIIGVATGAIGLFGAVSETRSRGDALAADRAAEQALIAERKTQEGIASTRELADLGTERRRAISRTRAAMAAGGADLSSGNAFAIIVSQELQFEEAKRRITEDAAAIQKSLTGQLAASRSAGRLEQRANIFGGVATALESVRTALNRSRTPVTSGR